MDRRLAEDLRSPRPGGRGPPEDAARPGGGPGGRPEGARRLARPAAGPAAPATGPEPVAGPAAGADRRAAGDARSRRGSTCRRRRDCWTASKTAGSTCWPCNAGTRARSRSSGRRSSRSSPRSTSAFHQASDTTNVHTTGLGRHDRPADLRPQPGEHRHPSGRPANSCSTSTSAGSSRRGPRSRRAWRTSDSITEQIADAEAAVPALERLVAAYKSAVGQRNADVLSYYAAQNDLAQKRIDLLKLKQQLMASQGRAGNRRRAVPAGPAGLPEPPNDGPSTRPPARPRADVPAARPRRPRRSCRPPGRSVHENVAAMDAHALRRRGRRPGRGYWCGRHTAAASGKAGGDRGSRAARRRCRRSRR